MEAAIRVAHSLYGPFEKKRIRAKTNVFNIMYFRIQLMRTTRVIDDSAQGLAAQNGREVPGAGSWALRSFARHVSDVRQRSHAPASGTIAS
jgi:hypothetical protein